MLTKSVIAIYLKVPNLFLTKFGDDLSRDTCIVTVFLNLNTEAKINLTQTGIQELYICSIAKINLSFG